MRQGIQTFLQEAGESACYALCIVKIAEEVLGRELDVVRSLTNGIDAGYISYDWQNQNDNDNFFVRHPDRFLSALAGKKCTIRVEQPEYRTKDNEYAVQCWQRNKTGQTITHFRRPAWDSLAHSVTVAQGRIASLRIFTVHQGT